MVNLLLAPDDDALTDARRRPHHLRPGLRHRRHALARPRSTSRELQPGRHGRGLRPGAERRVLGDLPLRHDDQGPGRRATSRSATPSPTTATGDETFDYMLANPPFGVEWKKVKDDVEDEHATLGYAGRFGAGLPRINDGSLLFLQHMISKMKPAASTARAAAASRSSSTARRCSPARPAPASPRSAAGSWRTTGSKAIVALPDQLFYNTGISTYFWILTNRKTPDAQGQGHAARRPRPVRPRCASRLGDKRKELTRRADRRDHPALRRRAARRQRPGAPAARQGEGLRQRGLRLPAHHRRAPAASCASRSPTRRSPRLRESKAVAEAARDAERGLERRSKPLARHGLVARSTAARTRCTAIAAKAGVHWPSARAAARRRFWAAIGVPRPGRRGADRSKGATRARLRPARQRERAAGRGHRRVPARARCSRTSRTPGSTTAKTKIGYEIPFTRHFYVYTPPTTAGRDRRRAQGAGGRDSDAPERGDTVTWPRLPLRRIVAAIVNGGTPTTRGPALGWLLFPGRHLSDIGTVDGKRLTSARTITHNGSAIDRRISDGTSRLTYPFHSRTDWTCGVRLAQPWPSIKDVAHLSRAPRLDPLYLRFQLASLRRAPSRGARSTILELLKRCIAMVEVVVPSMNSAASPTSSTPKPPASTK